MTAKPHPKGEVLTNGSSFEGRSMIALEHIALSLEAIEGHLAQIAASTGGQNIGPQLVKALHGIGQAIAEHR